MINLLYLQSFFTITVFFIVIFDPVFAVKENKVDSYLTKKNGYQCFNFHALCMYASNTGEKKFPAIQSKDRE